MKDAKERVTNIEGGEKEPVGAGMPHRGILAKTNDALTAAAKKAPVPMAIAGGLVVDQLSDRAVTPGLNKVGSVVKKTVTRVAGAGGAKAAEETAGEGARQAVSASASGMKTIAAALPRAAAEEVPRSVVKDVGKNAMAGGGGFVVKAVRAVAKAVVG